MVASLRSWLQPASPRFQAPIPGEGVGSDNVVFHLLPCQVRDF